MTANWLPSELSEEHEEAALCSLLESLANRFDWPQSKIEKDDITIWGAEVDVGRLMQAMAWVLTEMSVAWEKDDFIRAAQRCWAITQLSHLLEAKATALALEDRRKN